MSKLSILLLLNLNGGSNNTADGVVAVFAPNFSAAIGNEDSYKFTNLDENLAINCGGTLLSIEGRPTITTSDTLPLQLWQFRQNSYSFQFDGSNFSPNLIAVVKDKFLNQETAIDLAGSTVVGFNITSDPASSARDRFMIVFRKPVVASLAITDGFAFYRDNGAQITWTSHSKYSIKGYEIEKSTNGQEFDKAAFINDKRENLNSERYSWFDADAANGISYYRIKTVDNNGTINYSDVMKVNVSNPVKNTLSPATINVFPNPVKGNVIGFTLNNVSKGDYMVALYNNEGQKIFSKTLNYTGTSSRLTIEVDKQMRRGIYKMQLSNNALLINKTIMVE